ncbi:protein disulfide oxidoreductase [Actinophytocola sediminis]
MTRRFPVLIAVLLGLTLTGCGTEGEPAPNASGQPKPASQAPDDLSERPAPSAEVPEQLRFTAKTIDGEVFDGASLHGTPALLWFWAPWCPTCQAEAPTIAEVARTDGVRFVGVAAQDEVPAMRAFVDRFGLGTFPHLADRDAAIWQRFGVDYQPAYAFVSADGTVEVVTDLLEPAELRDRVRALR